MSINELRELAVNLGANRKSLYGLSKQSMVVIINRLERGKEELK